MRAGPVSRDPRAPTAKKTTISGVEQWMRGWESTRGAMTRADAGQDAVVQAAYEEFHSGRRR